MTEILAFEAVIFKVLSTKVVLSFTAVLKYIPIALAVEVALPLGLTLNSLFKVAVLPKSVVPSFPPCANKYILFLAWSGLNVYAPLLLSSHLAPAKYAPILFLAFILVKSIEAVLSFIVAPFAPYRPIEFSFVNLIFPLEPITPDVPFAKTPTDLSPFNSIFEPLAKFIFFCPYIPVDFFPNFIVLLPLYTRSSVSSPVIPVLFSFNDISASTVKAPLPFE